MATKHAWGNVKSGGGSGGGKKFMKLKEGSKNKFRPIGDPVVFWRYYIPGPDGKFMSAITDDKENCVVYQKHGIEPKQRGAINVIDREDKDENGVCRLKILEGPYSLFCDMKSMWEGEGESPGAADGAEFGVNVTIPGGVKKNTKYKMGCYGKSPVSDAERAAIKKPGADGKPGTLFNLEKEFEATPQNEIEARLGLVASSKASNDSFDDDSSGKADSGDDMSF